MRYIGIFQIMEPGNQLKADFETSITFEPLEIFDAVFTVVLRRISSIILYMCLYLHWGLFNYHQIHSLSVPLVNAYITQRYTTVQYKAGKYVLLCNGLRYQTVKNVR